MAFFFFFQSKKYVPGDLIISLFFPCSSSTLSNAPRVTSCVRVNLGCLPSIPSHPFPSHPISPHPVLSLHIPFIHPLYFRCRILSHISISLSCFLYLSQHKLGTLKYETCFRILNLTVFNIASDLAANVSLSDSFLYNHQIGKLLCPIGCSLWFYLEENDVVLKCEAKDFPHCYKPFEEIGEVGVILALF